MLRLMNNTIHKPEIMLSVENALAYLLVLSFVTAGVAFVFLGAISPIFIPALLRHVEKQAVDGPPELRQIYWRSQRNGIISGIMVWFIAAWAFLVFAFYPYF